MCQDLGFSSAKIFNFALLQSSAVDTDEVLEKFRQKINISRHVDVWRCEAEQLKIAADGDNTWQIGQIKVASYFQNKPKQKRLSTQRILENLKTRKTGAKD